MRRTRRLTTGERWELGLFLTMMIVGCLCLTAILNLNSLPNLFAFADHSTTASPAAILPAPFLTRPSIAPATVSFTPSLSAEVPLQYPEAPTIEPALPATPRPSFKRPAVEVKWFGGKKYRFVKTLRLRVTAYAPDSRCCWPYPGTTTASGLSVKTNRGLLVAADTRVIPLHALVAVPGYARGEAVPVLDRGGAIKGRRLDVLMPNFSIAKEWGSRMIDVKVYMPAE